MKITGMKKIAWLISFVICILSTTCLSQQNYQWSGTVTWLKTSKGNATVRNNNNGHEEVSKWEHFFAYHIAVKFINDKGIVVRNDTATKWGKDSLFFSNPDVYMLEETTTKIYCSGKDTFILDVEFSEDNKTYWISFYTPTCQEVLSSQKVNNILGTSSNSSTADHEGIQINLPANFIGHPVGKNPKILSGSFQEVVPPNPADPSSAEIITKGSWNLRACAPGWKDQYSEKKIATLDARVRGPASRFLKRTYDELCIKLRVADAFRSVEEQDKLYALGRTQPGNIATRARGGTSFHNYGLAIDVYILNDDGTIDLVNELPPEVVAIALEEGFLWGGNWDDRDPPHFEMPFGQTAKQLKAQHEKGQ